MVLRYTELHSKDVLALIHEQMELILNANMYKKQSTQWT